ncbi:unnamed protein product, partial [Laminaria digitata]
MDNGSDRPISRVTDVCEDSDADENPFEHDSERGDSSKNPANSFLSARDDAHSQLGSFTAVPPGSSAPTTTMPATSFSQDRSRAVPSRRPAPLDFPTIGGRPGGMTNPAHSYGTALHGMQQQGPSLASVPQVDMEDTEVETETEGETENEDSESEYGGHVRSAAAAA